MEKQTLLRLKEEGPKLEALSVSTGRSKAEIVRKLLSSEYNKIPETLKPRMRSTLSEYEQKKKEAVKRIYFGDLTKPLENFTKNTGEPMSELIRQLLTAAIRQNPDLFADPN